VGALADLNTFSFHPAKHVTTLEGGAVTCASDELAARMRVFRNHGISTEARSRDGKGAWHYEQHELGHNLRISDVQCALGASQLLRLADNVERRRAIAARYHAAFAKLEGIAPLAQRTGVRHAFHLYLVRVQPDALRRSRDEVLWALRAEGIGATLHYPAVHLQPYYRGLGNAPGTCPNAERAADELITLPLYPSLSDADVDDVITAVTKVVRAARP
jgi:perosamine synthetase